MKGPHRVQAPVPGAERERNVISFHRSACWDREG